MKIPTFTTKFKRMPLLGALLTLSLVSVSANAAIALVTVPNDKFDTEGGSNNSIPFGTDGFCSNGIRYQQVVPGNQIGGGNIGSLAFRLNGGETVNPGNMSYTGMTVTFSSTLATPATLSSTFADNVGPNATVVFSGDLTVSPTINAMAPHNFDFEIPVNAAFEFDGSISNLLIDISIEGCFADGGDPVFLDAVSDEGMGRVFGNDKDAPSGNLPTTTGLVLQLVISTPPPLPYFQGLGGNWTIVGHDGEGFMIDVLPDGRLVLFWFTYDGDGDNMWLIGNASDLFGNEATMDLVQVTGPSFGPTYDPADQTIIIWGTIVIRFFDCNTGEITFISSVGFGAGTYQIQRVYTTEQSSCPS